MQIFTPTQTAVNIYTNVVCKTARPDGYTYFNIQTLGGGGPWDYYQWGPVASAPLG